MKRNLFVLGMMTCSTLIFAQPVILSEAEDVAAHVYERQTKKSAPAQGVPIVKSTNTLAFADESVLYVVEYTTGGYAVVSGDRSAPPVLGYCDVGSSDTVQMPPGLRYLLHRYAVEIAALRSSSSAEAQTVREENNRLWAELLAPASTTRASNTNALDPLLVTQWSQGSTDLEEQKKSFNRLCPAGYPAGCTAVAMAQILYYWDCRVDPQGQHSYHWRKGDKTLSADFGGTRYPWNKMEISNPDDDNSTLIFHTGVSCEMNYKENGSTSTPGRAWDGFVNF